MQLTLAIAVAASLLSFTSANQFSKTCTNITLSATGNLAAECRDKKQVPKQASLNLNSLIGYSAGKFQVISLPFSLVYFPVRQNRN